MVILCCILWFCTSCTFDFDEPQVCPYNVRLNYRYAGRPDAGQLSMYVDNIRQATVWNTGRENYLPDATPSWRGETKDMKVTYYPRRNPV